VLGDFNITEDPIDRAPIRADDPGATESLRNLRQHWDIIDTWRAAHPNEIAFTYRANNNGQQIQSRLDRIYVARQIANHTFAWKMIPASVPTDHWLVQLKYAPVDTPVVGQGRWTWPLASLQKKELLDAIITKGRNLQSELDKLQTENTPRETSNPQTLWESFKNDIKKLAKEHTKDSIYKINSRSRALEKDRKSTLAHPNFENDENLRTHKAFLAQELAHLEKLQATNQRDILKAKLDDHGEKLGGAWSAMSNDKKPRNPTYRLKIPDSNPPQFEQNTKRMAELVRNYHNNLQDKDLKFTENLEVYAERLHTFLQEIPENQQIQEPQLTAMNWRVERAHTSKALKLTKNGSATGMDGCPYELWKALDQRFETDTATNKPGFDIAKILTDIFQDIQEKGVDPRTNFTLGWMCPIYKKKDPTEVRNYCPITLLNTDYKLLTKVLALQLLDYVHELIHPDQTGFIPKRSIFDHICLAKAIINYADLLEENGVIIALDQEKAYDKIRHNYLWEMLRAFKLPEPFIQTIRSLYQNAETLVAINSIFSSHFKVRCGVRQGDPLSCPIFNLAIEPLACKIRNDPTIHGLRIPGLEEKLAIKMFADDTSLYLSHEDRFDHVQTILDNWCAISGAKFNIEKTEIVPIGVENHRQNVITQRKINPLDDHIFEDNIHIAKDGEAIRILGAWVGNKADDMTPWEPVIDKINHKLKTWNKLHPTLDGRRIIIQAVIGGHTQFLTQVQGMPDAVEKALMKIATTFIWDNDSSPRIALHMLQRPLEEGGLNLLNINTRNEAIDIMWLKTYLNFTQTRPT